MGVLNSTGDALMITGSSTYDLVGPYNIMLIVLAAVIILFIYSIAKNKKM